MGKLEKKIRQNLIGKTGSHLKIFLYVNWEHIFFLMHRNVKLFDFMSQLEN